MAAVEREAALLLDLIQSAFIVQLAGLYQSALHSVLLTEFLAGGDLVTRYLHSITIHLHNNHSDSCAFLFCRTACPGFCLTERKCQVYIRQVVRGLAYIHSQGILHLDIKPFNIMFANKEDDYNLRIIDFGLAERLPAGQIDMPIRMCGTLEYMSPEVK